MKKRNPALEKPPQKSRRVLRNSPHTDSPALSSDLRLQIALAFQPTGSQALAAMEGLLQSGLMFKDLCAILAVPVDKISTWRRWGRVPAGPARRMIWQLSRPAPAEPLDWLLWEM